MAITLLVDQQALENTATIVGTKSERMLEILSNIKTTINSLEGSWASEAGQEIRAQITAMQSRFDQYKQVTDSYKAFLIKTAQTYAETEGQLKAMASDFKM